MFLLGVTRQIHGSKFKVKVGFIVNAAVCARHTEN